MDVPDRIGQPLLAVLALIAVEELLVLVDIARDDVEIKPLRRLRLAKHEERQGFGAGVTQPLVDGEAIALGLRNLLALLVEEELVVEAFRRQAADRAADFAGELDRIDQVLARHFVINGERIPAHRPVRLPLQLAMATGDRRRHFLFGVRVFIGDGAGLGVVRQNGHLQHNAGARRNRQERRIGLRTLFAQRRQHDRHHLFEMRQHAQERLVEAAGGVAGGRGQEFVFEAEGIEEGAQPRVVVLAEAAMGTERIGHLGQRLAEMLLDQVLVRDVVRHLAQAVHVVRKGDQPRFHLVVGEHAEGMAHHGGARDLAEGADMRQARWPVAGRENDFVFRLLLQPRDDLARLLERPGVRLLGECSQIRGVLNFGYRHDPTLETR